MQIVYGLAKNKEGDPDAGMVTENSFHIRHNFNLTKVDHFCLTLALCLFHQACVFRFGNEFCLHDPSPGVRKVVKVTVTCTREAELASAFPDAAVHMFYDQVSMPHVELEVFDNANLKPNVYCRYVDDIFLDVESEKVLETTRFRLEEISGLKFTISSSSIDHIVIDVCRNSADAGCCMNAVIHLQYRSRVEDGVRDYLHTDIVQHRSSELEVFDVGCPMPDEAIIRGFRGDCSGTTSVPPAAWTVLARASRQCRHHLTTVLCAFLLSPAGACLPPQWSRSGQAGYDYSTLPMRGRRPSLLRHSQRQWSAGARLAFSRLISGRAEHLLRRHVDNDH